MAEAQFQPGPNSGRGINAADSFYKGVEDRQSMMSRASQNRQQLQMEQMRAQQLAQAEILAPVIRAKAQADLITAGASISNATRMETLRAQAGAASKTANDEFLDAVGLADWEMQSFELGQLQAKYSWMGQLPEYKGFLDAVDKARANAVTRQTVDLTLENRLQQAQMGADTRVAVAEAGAGSREKVAEIGADSREAVASIRPKAAATNSEDITDRMEYRAAQQSAIQADKDAARASAAGDEGNAAIYRRHAQEFRDEAKKAITKPTPTKINVPFVNDGRQPKPSAPEDTPAQDEPKLYTAPEVEGGVPAFAPEVKTPEDIIKAMQQMVDDGAIDAEQARETLQKLGFTRKEG